MGRAKKPGINAIHSQNLLGRNPSLVKSLIVQHSEVVSEPNDSHTFAVSLDRGGRVPLKGLVRNPVHILRVQTRNLVDRGRGLGFGAGTHCLEKIESFGWNCGFWIWEWEDDQLFQTVGSEWGVKNSHAMLWDRGKERERVLGCWVADTWQRVWICNVAVCKPVEGRTLICLQTYR